MQGYEKLLSTYQDIDPDKKPENLIIKSKGGNGLAGILIGNFIYEEGLNVKVNRYCLSSCANYIFPAGNKKILSIDALVIFHGGFDQGNLLSKIVSAFKSIKEGAVDFKDDKAGKEAAIRFRESSITNAYVKHFPSYANCKYKSNSEITPEEAAKLCLSSMKNIEYDFYERIMINRRLPYEGQVGIYESKYKSYEFMGFYYDQEALQALGIHSLKVSRNWNPSSNRYFENAYLVDQIQTPKEHP